jgi:uncharacterized membrane protein YoaK (UPF0700 family)
MTKRTEAPCREPASPHTTARDLLLVVLAMAAGCVDAMSFLGLGQVLTAAMTGNTVLLGLSIGQADAQAALRAGIALAGFVAGAILGAAIVERGARAATWSPAVTTGLGLELLVLITLALGWHLAGGEADRSLDELHALIARAGLAMGIQSAAAQRIGVAGVATTYVTGTLTSLAARLVRWLRSLRASASAATRGYGKSDRAAPVRAPWLPAAVWLAYGAGAVVAGAVKLWWPALALSPAIFDAPGEISWPLVTLLLPIGIVALVIVLAAIRFRRARQVREPVRRIT